MYEATFGLSRRPFPSLPQPAFYFPAAAAEHARQTLFRCAERGEGVAMVIGPTGCGKSLLGEILAQHFHEVMHVVQLASGRLESRRALLQAILYELGRPFRGMDEGELRLALTEYLSRGEERRPMLLLVDEAEALSMRLLDELRMATNLAAAGEPCTRLVLLGSPALEEKLTSPKLESFSQRIVARCYLEALNRTETKEYVLAQLAAASASEILFDDEACDAVYQATDGVPRLINQLCDHALILAYADGQTEVGRPCIEEAWADLQQLPTPWNGDAGDGPSKSIIEFGGLDGMGEPETEQAEGSEFEDSRPMLHLAPDEDDVIAGSHERLDRIEESLDELEDDFQPAGAIVPEVELVFHDPADLINEDFQEEELVVDRYVRAEPMAEPARQEEITYPLRGEEQPEAAEDSPTLSITVEQDEEILTAASEEATDATESSGDESEPQDGDGESHTLDIHDKPAVPPLKHKDFARLFSNLRRTAQ